MMNGSKQLGDAYSSKLQASSPKDTEKLYHTKSRATRFTDMLFTPSWLGGLCGGDGAQVIRLVIWTSDHLSVALAPEATKLPMTYQYMQHLHGSEIPSDHTP